jgi:hypothetical protein
MLVKALSLHQPWASALFVPDLKPIETRHWKTDYRGLLAIHAAKKSSRNVVDFFNYRVNTHPDESEAFRKMSIYSFGCLPLGAVIGTVELVDCVPTCEPLQDTNDLNGDCVMGYEIKQFLENQKRFQSHCRDFRTVNEWGNFGTFRYGWVFKNPKLLSTALPWKGMQSFFTVDINP